MLPQMGGLTGAMGGAAPSPELGMAPMGMPNMPNGMGMMGPDPLADPMLMELLRVRDEMI